jgi:hypothetical protein
VQWHWGNIGSAIAGIAVGLSLVIGAAYALITGQGPAWLRESRERARAQAEQARQQAALAEEERKQIELDRERVLYGWAGAGSAGEVYTVALVADPAEMDTAREELAATPARPSQYVILRVAEHPDPFGNANRARSLRQLIETSGLLSRAPEAGEYEVLREAARALAAKRWPANPG